ncbi:hypothetical protein PHLCEN_2v5984 [Hermanssonia centrifuga]|uniref:Uncharacterized protein n=1 Tax=Hermanssonia centrifuga TaxID=98765 RepID=A0A2R6P0S8_9APHY|nr:hypothetical protein PHLCEN_2v5984 [Hermanssonia centrifuga]
MLKSSFTQPTYREPSFKQPSKCLMCPTIQAVSMQSLNSPRASISYLVRELPQGPTSANPTITMTFSKSSIPLNFDTSARDSSKIGKSNLKSVRGVTLTVWRTLSAPTPSIMKNAAWRRAAGTIR